MDLLPSAFVSRDEASNVMAYANEETAVNEMKPCRVVDVTMNSINRYFRSVEQSQSQP